MSKQNVLGFVDRNTENLLKYLICYIFDNIVTRALIARFTSEFILTLFM